MRTIAYIWFDCSNSYIFSCVAPRHCTKRIPCFNRLLFNIPQFLQSASSAPYFEPTKPATLEPSTIILSPDTAVLSSIGQRIRIDATVLDQDSRMIADATVFWRSDSDDIATVSDQGIVTAVSSGTTQINVRSGYATASATISVEQETVSIEITPSSATLSEMGETIQLVATIYDLNDDVIVGATATWSSSDPAVASVDTNGLVTAVDNGSTQITATADSVSDSATLTVKLGNRMLDREALIALYNETGGPNWTNNTDWLTNASPDVWHGISTETSNDRVTEVDLSENNLFGVIPPEIGNLKALEILGLYGNMLSGEIPSEIGNLKWLEILWLNRNLLSGEIPTTIGSLSKLYVLDISDNQISGGIPVGIGNLKALELLHLSRNQLSGEIPPEIGQLMNLKYLDLSWNENLSGTLPIELTTIPSLSELNLRGTRVCAPAGDLFDEWLDGLDYFSVDRCLP